MIEEFGLVGKILFGFAFYYPLFMAYHWMIGALYYFFHYEIKLGKVNSPPQLPAKEVAGKPRAKTKKNAGNSRRHIRALKDLIKVMVPLQKRPKWVPIIKRSTPAA